MKIAHVTVSGEPGRGLLRLRAADRFCGGGRGKGMAGKRKSRAVPGSHGDAESPCEVLYSERPQRGGDPVPAGGLTGQRGCRICDAGILSQTRQPLPFLSVGLPASGGAAGKDQSVGGNRQTDLLRADGSAVWPHLRPQHVGQDCRLQPGGVGVDQEEKRLF